MQHLWVRCVPPHCTPKVLAVPWQEDVSQKEYPEPSPGHGFTSWEKKMEGPDLPGSENGIFRPRSLVGGPA